MGELLDRMVHEDPRFIVAALESSMTVRDLVVFAHDAKGRGFLREPVVVSDANRERYALYDGLPRFESYDGHLRVVGEDVGRLVLQVNHSVGDEYALWLHAELGNRIREKRSIPNLERPGFGLDIYLIGCD
jgi:hypothetical protein